MSNDMTDKSRNPAAATPNRLANESALSEDELSAVSGGMRKSAGNQTSGVMFLAFAFKLVAV
jgi:hypothetical protein